MEQQRPSTSPAPMANNSRPANIRKRSNSLPIVDALGCSTPEAELILAEGRAAVRSRHASRRRRNNRPEEDGTPYHPQNHLKYLEQDRDSAAEDEEPVAARITRHTRIPSNITDKSGSTITGPVAPLNSAPISPKSPDTPLGNYSANLAQFIKSQLNSIPTFQTTVYPRSCPDLSAAARSPPQSPTMLERRQADLPKIIEMPQIRPPLKSQFSAWSSTDDETEEDHLPPLPSMDIEEPKKGSRTNDDTPSLLRYYQNTSGASFLFSSTPLEEGGEAVHPNASGFAFPAPTGSTSDTCTPASNQDQDYPSSALSHPQLSSSSAPSFSSASTASYFDCKQPMSLAPHLRDRIIAAVSPQNAPGKIMPALSPFEGDALANVHDLYVESQSRVHIDGMTFDMVRDFQSSAHRVPTPC